MGIAQGTTPYLMMSIKGYDLTTAAAIIVTLKTQSIRESFDQTRITVTADNNESLLTIHLTQTETLALLPNKAQVQVRWRDGNDEAFSTVIEEISVSDCIYKGVV